MKSQAQIKKEIAICKDRIAEAMTAQNSDDYKLWFGKYSELEVLVEDE